MSFPISHVAPTHFYFAREISLQGDYLPPPDFGNLENTLWL